MEEVTTTKSSTASSERWSKSKGKPPDGMVISSNFSSPDVRSKRSNGKPVATPNMAADSATPVPANADNRNPPISQARDPGSEEIVQKGQQFLDAASSQSAAPADVNDDEEVKASGVHDQPAVHSIRIRGEERS